MVAAKRRSSCYSHCYNPPEIAMHSLTRSMLLLAGLLFATAASAGGVSRALFTTAVDDREPVATVDSLDSSSTRSVTFFTELNDMSGQLVTHQWTHQDKVMFEKTFEVKGERWRVWTSKTLIPDWSGTWTVNVLDSQRMVLASESIEYN